MLTEGVTCRPPSEARVALVDKITHRLSEKLEPRFGCSHQLTGGLITQLRGQQDWAVVNTIYGPGQVGGRLVIPPVLILQPCHKIVCASNQWTKIKQNSVSLQMNWDLSEPLWWHMLAFLWCEIKKRDNALFNFWLASFRQTQRILSFLVSIIFSHM